MGLGDLTAILLGIGIIMIQTLIVVIGDKISKHIDREEDLADAREQAQGAFVRTDTLVPQGASATVIPFKDLVARRRALLEPTNKPVGAFHSFETMHTRGVIHDQAENLRRYVKEASIGQAHKAAFPGERKIDYTSEVAVPNNSWGGRDSPLWDCT